MVYESPDLNDGYTELTLFTRNFNDSRFGKFELAKHINITQLMCRSHKIFNIFELVAHEKFECPGDDIEKKAEAIIEEWGQPRVILDEFCEWYNIGLEIGQREEYDRGRQVCISLQVTIPSSAPECCGQYPRYSLFFLN